MQIDQLSEIHKNTALLYGRVGILRSDRTAVHSQPLQPAGISMISKIQRLGKPTVELTLPHLLIGHAA